MSYQNRFEPRYDPSAERRSNPHHREYDPKFDPSAPPPTYQRFPQPQYDRDQIKCRERPAGQEGWSASFRALSTEPYQPSWSPNPIYPAYRPRSSYQDQGRMNPKQWQTFNGQGQPRCDPRHGMCCQQGGYHRTQPADGKRHFEPERYQEKKFDYRLDDRYHRPHPNQPSYHSPRRQQDYQDSPQQTYRGGAGDYQDTSRDDSTDDPRRYDTNKGYLVMMRFRPNDLSDVVTAIQESLSTLAAHHGYVIGFSEPRDMQILIPSHQMMANDQWWDPRSNRSSRYAVCCFWFKDIFQAKRWFESSKRIRQPDFPNSSPYQVVAVPLTYGRNREPMPFGPETEEVTLLWSEYPNIYERYENDFLVNYSEPARHFMKSYGANPNVSVCRYKAGWPAEPNKYGQPGYARLDVHHERVGRAIRTGWVAPETFITVSTFPSMESVVHFYRSEEYQNCRSSLNRYSDPVFVAITLRKVKGTSRG